MEMLGTSTMNLSVSLFRYKNRRFVKYPFQFHTGRNMTRRAFVSIVSMTNMENVYQNFRLHITHIMHSLYMYAYWIWWQQTTEYGIHIHSYMAYGIWIKKSHWNENESESILRWKFHLAKLKTLFNQKIICLRLRFTMMMSNARLHMLDFMWLNTHIWQYDSCDCNAFPFNMLQIGMRKIGNLDCNTCEMWDVRRVFVLDEGLLC